MKGTPFAPSIKFRLKFSAPGTALFKSLLPLMENPALPWSEVNFSSPKSVSSSNLRATTLTVSVALCA